VKRGEIWTVAGVTDHTGSPRPVVVIQDDLFPTSSIAVCPFTLAEVDAPLLRRVVEPSPSNGLSQSFRLMADKITTVPRSSVGQLVGRLEADHMAWIGQAIVVFFGLAGPQRRVSGECRREMR
jgi:mRNA interferase MazF